MTRLRVIATLAVAAVLVGACGSHSAARLSTAPPPPWHAETRPPEARTVPSQLRFIAKTIDGQDFHGQDLLGKRAVLWFWTPWCPACQTEAPMVGRVATANPAVTFIGVAGLDKVPAMRTFVDKYRLTGFTELADTDGSVWTKFGVTQQPAFAFVDPNGNIDVVKSGLSETDLTRRVAALKNQ